MGTVITCGRGVRPRRMYETLVHYILYPVRLTPRLPARPCSVDRGERQQYQKTKDTQSGGYDATAPCGGSADEEERE